MALLVGPQHRIAMSNRSFQQLFLHGADGLGQPIDQVLPEAREQGFCELLDHVFETGKIHFGKEALFVPKREAGGELSLYLDYRYQPILDQKNKVLGVMVIAVDVTQRVLDRLRLEKSELDLMSAVKVAKIGFYDWDLDADTVAMSPYFSEIYEMGSGVSQNLAMGRIDPRDRDRVGQEIEQLIEGVKTLQVQYRILKNDSSTVWLEAMGETRADAQGRPSHLFGTIRDITELKLATEALAEQQQLNQSIIDQSPVGIALLGGAEHRFVSVNARWTRLFGQSFNVGQTLDEACSGLPNIHAVLGKIKQAYATSIPFLADEVEVLISQDGCVPEKRFYSLVAQQVLDANAERFGIFCQVRDATPEVLARIHLEKSIEELRRDQRLREHFSATLTHDLRSPMTSVRMSAERIARKSEDVELVGRLAERIVRMTDRADHMVQDLLDASRLRAGDAFQVNKINCSIKSVLEACADELRQMHARDIRLDAQDDDVRVLCDPMAIGRVLDNLVGNAVKYGAASTPITISLQIEAATVALSVHNQGAPIHPSEQQALFDPYRRSQSAVDQGIKGWGIGLSLVKAIAHAHGGDLRVRSNRGEGTTFFFSLPNEAIVDRELGQERRLDCDSSAAPH